MGSFNCVCSLSRTEFDETMNPDVKLIAVAQYGTEFIPISFPFDGSYYDYGMFTIDGNQPEVKLLIELLEKYNTDFTKSTLEDIINSDVKVSQMNKMLSVSLFAVHKDIYNYMINDVSYNNFRGTLNYDNIRNRLIDNLDSDLKQTRYQYNNRPIKLHNDYRIVDLMYSLDSPTNVYHRFGDEKFIDMFSNMNWFLMACRHFNISLEPSKIGSQCDKIDETIGFLEGMITVLRHIPKNQPCDE